MGDPRLGNGLCMCIPPAELCITCNIAHLYGFLRPARLNGRFDRSSRSVLQRKTARTGETSLDPIYMTGPLAYIGGKNRVAKKIIATFPTHTTYAEPFAGGAQIFFHKEPSAVEVLSDLDGDIVNFFRCCQLHYEELLRYLKFILVSRKWFDLYQIQDSSTLTDIQRAARFFYLQKNAYGGLVRNRQFHYSVVEPPSFNPGRLPEVIEKAHQRLARVHIECLPYGEILKRFDRSSTFFYLDPPYWGRNLYRFNFTPEDFAELAERLGSLKGKFVLSINDVPEIRKLFGSFRLREIEFHYSAQPKAGKRYRELLISNFR